MSKALKGNKCYRISFLGQVQGVGFRPAIYRLAVKNAVNGWVANDSSGAILEIEGTVNNLKSFFSDLSDSLPVYAKIKKIFKKNIPCQGFDNFIIKPSKSNNKINLADIPPDLSICQDCKEELFNPLNRRYLYPFINCTNCGPRFSIIKEIPYDRPKTTMQSFPMCENCAKEYNDPADRRFHAQPNACPVCGPQIKLVSGKNIAIAYKHEALNKAINFLKKGKIIAVKGIGGYHIACDAMNIHSILKLRKRKNRPFKPFAVMFRDIEAAKKFCRINLYDEKLLYSFARPIVLLRKHNKFSEKLNKIIDLIAPGNNCIGAMLPYTPLHYLLFSKHIQALIMTSGNKSDEPICIDDDAAYKNLSSIVDYFLMHDRLIHNRCDDSIIQNISAKQQDTIFIRRSRGFVPEPVPLNLDNNAGPSIFAAGGHLKNTFCITRDKNAYMSQYIGDINNKDSMDFYEEAFIRYKTFLGVEPKIIAHDMHPDYLSAIFAKNFAANNNKKIVAIQHHQAHVASVLAENKIVNPVIGFAFDGTGFGLDGKIWGSECFLFKDNIFTRIGHFEYFPLPGGDAAVKEIWRTAVSLLNYCGINNIPLHLRKYQYKQIISMADKRINTFDCCSIGRLFDAAACIIGVRNEATYEAQAAVEMQSLAEKIDKSLKKGYNFKLIINEDGSFVLPVKSIINGLLTDKEIGLPLEIISLKFHKTLAEAIVIISKYCREKFKISDIVLSGGVFQNGLLLNMTKRSLELNNFNVYYNQIVPPNDGGISLGQAWIAKNLFDKKGNK